MPDVVDRDGWPIREDAYVRVETSLQGIPIRFHMVVTAFHCDRKGPYLEGVEWRDGKPTGTRRLARPETCQVRRPPASLKEWRADRAHFEGEMMRRRQAREKKRKAPRRTTI